MNLQWKTSGAGVTTQVFTLAPVFPWGSTAVNINAINPGNTPLPVELTSFTAAYKNSAVTLNWQTKTEVNNYGFEIERKNIRQSDVAWQKVGFVEGHGTSNAPKEYLFTDSKLKAGKYFYRLKQIDRDGAFSYSQEIEVTVGAVPKVFQLEQNYPNPFNPSTTIRFSLPMEGRVSLKIYDQLGREVTTLVNGSLNAGPHETRWDASGMASGLYFFRIDAVGADGSRFARTNKMVLMK